MRKFGQFLVVLLLVFSASTNVFSDETRISLYGVRLNDLSYDGSNYNLYAMLNNYLDLEGSEAYSSSLDLFNKRGIDPTVQWTTSGSSLLQAFNMAGFWHQLNVLTSEGQEIYRLYDTGKYYESGKIYDLPDNINLDFQMLSFSPDDEENTFWPWYSDPLQNYDGEIHMLAFDITDLYNAKKDAAFTSVYMFGWEDVTGEWGGADFDYNDTVFIMTNLTPEPSATPEPATMLIFLVGGGLVSARYLRRRKNQ
ncbi:MAG: hypothetical protein LBK06_06105 [Planctomycetaceae bacterium]|jgi:hypothetical protein|nr:hypothetical protein [Planctomycetaceae bacterium]